MKLGSLSRGFRLCIILGFAVGGCTAIYEPATQCNTDSDCVKLSRQVPELSGSYCENNVCVVPKESNEGCTTNKECIDANNGDPAICRASSCIPLKHEECTLVYEEESLKTNNDVILIGAFAPLDNEQPAKDTVLQSYHLALDEIMSYTKGAVGYGQNSPDRPFVMVACQSDNAQRVSESFDFLAKTLKVPVIVTNQNSDDLEEQVSRLIRENAKPMFISPHSSDPNLTAMNDEGLLWHMLGSPVDLAPAYKKLIEFQASRVTWGEVRILTVVNDVLAMEQIADIVEKTLQVNGRSTTEASALGTYLRVSVESKDLHQNNPDTSKILQAITAMRPNVIVFLAGPEVIQPGIIETEGSWQAYGLENAPLYVLSHHLFNAEELSGKLFLYNGSESRIYGINFAGAKDPTLYNRYLSSLKAKYYDAYKPDYENFYDAAHFAMLSIIGEARNEPTNQITGSSVVKGFKRLIDKNGTKFDLTPEILPNLSTNILEADSEATVYLTGALGEPDFDVKTGVRRGRAAIWCVERHAIEMTFASGVVQFNYDSNDFDKDVTSCHIGSP
jgi:hypothetical protein